MMTTHSKRASIVFTDFLIAASELSDKLPHWNDERAYYSAYNSLIEELGEIAGLLTKHDLRGYQYAETFEESESIYRQKLVSELCDYLWILVVYQRKALLPNKDGHYINSFDDNVLYGNLLRENNPYDTSYSDYPMCVAVMRISHYVSSLYHTHEGKGFLNPQLFIGLLWASGNLFNQAYQKYGITLSEICQYNLDKLGKRYDKDGMRVDGKYHGEETKN